MTVTWWPGSGRECVGKWNLSLMRCGIVYIPGPLCNTPNQFVQKSVITCHLFCQSVTSDFKNTVKDVCIAHRGVRELCLGCRVTFWGFHPETKPKYCVTNAGVCDVHRENRAVVVALEEYSISMSGGEFLWSQFSVAFCFCAKKVDEVEWQLSPLNCPVKDLNDSLLVKSVCVRTTGNAGLRQMDLGVCWNELCCKSAPPVLMCWGKRHHPSLPFSVLNTFTGETSNWRRVPACVCTHRGFSLYLRVCRQN